MESLNDSLIKELVRRQEALRQVIDNDADAYQQNVLKYAPDHHDYLLNVIYAAMGMCGEAGEASELVKSTRIMTMQLIQSIWHESLEMCSGMYPIWHICLDILSVKLWL